MLLIYLKEKVVIKMFRQNYYNNHTYYPYQQGWYHTYFNPTYPTPNMPMPIAQEKKLSNDNITQNQEKVNSETDTDTMSEEKNDEKRAPKETSFKFGPFSYRNNTLSIFNFAIELDDLILIVLIFLLLLDTDTNYPLLIVLGLMLFNINLSTLNLF